MGAVDGCGGEAVGGGLLLVLPFGRLWYDGPSAASNGIGYASQYSRAYDAVVRVYDEAGKVIETHQCVNLREPSHCRFKFQKTR